MCRSPVRRGDRAAITPTARPATRIRVESEGGALARLYGELLGMSRYDPGYIKLKKVDGSLPEFGLESTRDEPRPRWPNPEYPQQVDVDIEVGDLDVGEPLVVSSARHACRAARSTASSRIPSATRSACTRMRR